MEALHSSLGQAIELRDLHHARRAYYRLNHGLDIPWAPSSRETVLSGMIRKAWENHQEAIREEAPETAALIEQYLEFSLRKENLRQPSCRALTAAQRRPTK